MAECAEGHQNVLVCPSCGGTGQVSSPSASGGSTQTTCPACNGSGHLELALVPHGSRSCSH